MNPNVYRWCAVPHCNNTSIKTPKKLFINVPMNNKIRKTWLNLARRDPEAISSKSVIYFCEDHFDLPNDMENYIQYLVVGSVSQIRMKSGCVPSKFECQSGKRKGDIMERAHFIKKRRKTIIKDSEKALAVESTPTNYSESACSSLQSSVLNTINEHQDGSTNTYPKCAEKSVQVHIMHKFRSKTVQTEIKLVNQLTSPIKPNHNSVSTSPIKITNCGTSESRTSSQLLQTSKKLFIMEEQSDSDISYTSSGIQQSSPSVQSLQLESASDCSELTEMTKKEEATAILKCTILKIMRDPQFYIGIPKSYCDLLDLIEEETKIPMNHILLCLVKIRLNIPFRQLAYDFSIKPTYASKIFFKNIPVIASVMQPFIVTLDKHLTKQTLLMAFRHKFYHTNCIIDCLEIEVQKPSSNVNQALSWSDYKKAYTIKYLVSCTPNGLVNYISPGYGGRVSDTCLIESCDFSMGLQSGMCVIADRGFKCVQQYSNKQGVQLVRPPSIVTGFKLSKSEVKETKRIASLRNHVERVIRRLREFNMLKPPALNINLVKILDEIIVIACALINVQESFIK